MAHVYFHVDLNAFFASAEVLLDPSLKGKPIVVSGNTRRSVVATASYEARAYGIHSAMPLPEARQLCPDLIIVEPHFTYYQNLSAQFTQIVREHADQIEQASIDECYAEVTQTIQKYPKPLDLAWQLQSAIHSQLGLPCSIGVAPNMFLAKMASDMKKPMGITVLRIREVSSKLWPLDISQMRGVGVKTVPLLKEMGINTIGDLANYKDTQALRPIFGRRTEQILARANGHDDRQIISDFDSKSVGVSETLLEDVTDYDELKGLFRILSRRLSSRLAEEKKAGNTLMIRIKYYDFSNVDRSRRLEQPIWKGDDLFVQAMSLFDENWNGNPVRLAGISVSGFGENGAAEQLNLFDENVARREETVSILKDLNHELGSNLLIRASQAEGKRHENG